MRIALATADFPPTHGGLSRLSTDLATHLHACGILSGVLAPRLEGGSSFDRDQPYPVHRVGGYDWGAARILPGLLASGSFRAEVLSKSDHLLAINPSFGGAYGYALEKAGSKLPYSLFAYAYEFLKFQDGKGKWGKKILERIYGGAHRILAISRFTREALIEFGVPTEKVVVCSLGVDVDRFHPEPVPGVAREKLEIEGEGPYLLTVGRLIPRKRNDLVLETLPDLAQEFPSLEYWIVGQGPEKKSLQEKAKSLGIEKHVRFWGKVSDEKLPLYYQACDLFLLPAVRMGASVEGLGLVLMEAAACGKPTLAAESGGIPEAMAPGETGILVPPNDREALGGTVSDLLADTERAQRLGEAGRCWVAREKNWKSCASRIVDLLAEEL